MGKITRQSEASHVTTLVGETGDVEFEELVPENQRNIEIREDGVSDDDAESEVHDDEDEEVADSDVNPVEPPASDLTGGFEATGEADVVHGDEPPVDKKIDDVKAWVGDDYVKAERALEAERKGQNRSGLVAWLEKVAASK